MPPPRRPRYVVLGLLLAVAAASAAWVVSRPSPPSRHASGAYRLADGRRLIVALPGDGRLTLRLPDGRTLRLFSRGAGIYDVGTDDGPRTGVVSFGAPGPDGAPATLTWKDGDGPALVAAREPADQSANGYRGEKTIP